ncbi:MAG: hypothetical protein PVJ49_19695 [Acidobacteriota bacterium]
MSKSLGKVVIVGLIVVSAFGTTRRATAQQPTRPPARDLSELWRSARYGETVIVTGVSGQVLRGTLAEVMVERGAVAVDVNEIRLELPVDGIHTIDIKERDPLGDGALKGALYGFAGAFALALISDEGGFFENVGAMAVGSVPLGTFFGAYIDSVHDARRTIYRGPALSSALTAPARTGIEPWTFAVRIVW